MTCNVTIFTVSGRGRVSRQTHTARVCRRSEENKDAVYPTASDLSLRFQSSRVPRTPPVANGRTRAQNGI